MSQRLPVERASGYIHGLSPTETAAIVPYMCRVCRLYVPLCLTHKIPSVAGSLGATTNACSQPRFQLRHMQLLQQP